MNQMMVFCRPGFETEAGRELTDVASRAGFFGYFQTQAGDGWFSFSLTGADTPSGLIAKVALDDLVFCRDWFEQLASIALPASDRVGAVVDALKPMAGLVAACERVEVRIPEDNQNRDLGNFARKWVAPLSRALRETGLLQTASNRDGKVRLEIFLPDFGTAFVGLSHAGNRSPFAGGIPRLRLPAAAPSRSALKLEEAWKVFLSPERRMAVLGGGKKAVDLGAAPGGWTWQLVREGMLVTAVDNGPMNPELMASGHVDHVTGDGFRWRPHRAVDWMVCDIVDQPRKTAALAVDWFAARLCRYSIFNLKLPMKKRYDEWLICRQILLEGLAEAAGNHRLRARHLYHDREEITCFIERLE